MSFKKKHYVLLMIYIVLNLSLTYCSNPNLFFANKFIPTVTIQSIKVSVFFRATYPGL